MRARHPLTVLSPLLLMLACGAARQQTDTGPANEATPAVARAPTPGPAQAQGPAPRAARMAIEPQVMEWGKALEVGPAQAMCDGLIHDARQTCYQQLPAAFIRAGRLEVAEELCPVATFHSFSCYGVVKDTRLLRSLFEPFSTALERLVEIDSAYETDPRVSLR